MAHPNNPIPGSWETVPTLPTTVKLFKIGASRFWQIQIYLGDGRVAKRSTGTEAKAEAIAKAKAFYNEVLLRQAQGQPVVVKPAAGGIAAVIKDLLDEDRARVARGERAESLVTDGEYMFEKDILPFFQNDNLKNIDYKRIQAFTAHLQKREVSSNTIKNNFVYLRKALKHAHKLNLLDRLPIFPKIETVDNPRDWFSKEQYNLLKKTLKECEGVMPEDKKCHVAITAELRLMSTFIVNTFLRPPGDLKELKNKHIQIVKQGKTRFLRLFAQSKVDASPVISMPDAVGIYEDIQALNSKAGFGKPDDYVFFPALKNRTYALQTMRLQFNHVLAKAGLKTSDQGTERTLYSLRHTAIMLRLVDGDVDLLTLARTCRTSVDMLERFYGSHLTAEMNVSKLHSFKKHK